MAYPSAKRSNADNRGHRNRFRLTVASRLMLVLSATAALSTMLAMALHDRALAADLERAAQERLARAGTAADQLVEAHLSAMGERYRAISGTPQLRATLEVDDAPTLEYYASTLRDREGPTLLAFLSPEGREVAVSGDADLLPAARHVTESGLISHAGQAFAVVVANLSTSAGLVGRMVAAERIDPDILSRWSELCGATVSFAYPGSTDPESLTRSARSLGDLDLIVGASLAAEHQAMRRSRLNLVAAGSMAIALSLLACIFLARGFVAPIHSIQHAADRIRSGDLDVRLGSERQDEIGDVARAFDLMLDGLDASRVQIERQLTALERSQQHLANAQEMARLEASSSRSRSRIRSVSRARPSSRASSRCPPTRAHSTSAPCSDASTRRTDRASQKPCEKRSRAASPSARIFASSSPTAPSASFTPRVTPRRTARSRAWRAPCRTSRTAGVPRSRSASSPITMR